MRYMTWSSLLWIVATEVCLIAGASGVALANPGDMDWFLQLGGGAGYSSPALSANGTLYIGVSEAPGDGNLTAVAPDGTMQWTIKVSTLGGVNQILSAAPVVAANGTIYIGTYEGNLTAVSPDGTREWTVELGNSIMGSPALSSNGTVYIGVSDGASQSNITAVAPDGTREWTTKVGGDTAIASSPAVAVNGTIYIGTYGGNLTAMSPDGTREWTTKVGNFIASCPSIAANGTIYIGVSDGGTMGNLTAVSPDGAKEWTIKVSGLELMASPTISPNGTIYIGVDGGNLTAVSPDGTKEWTLEVSDLDLFSSPAVSANGTIYIGTYRRDLLSSSDHGNLTAVAPDGSKLWTAPVGGLISVSSPTISSNGTVYIGAGKGSSGNLTAFEGDGSGLANSAWPKFQQNARNSNRREDVVDPCPGQGVRVVIRKTNSTAVSAETLSETFRLGGVPVTQKKAFIADIDTDGALCKFRFKVSGVDAKPGDLSFYELVDSDESSLPYKLYATSDSETEDGAWWITDANGDYLDRDAKLKKTSIYYLVFCLEDNGEYDQDATSGVIRDPCVATQGAASSSSSSSSGCALNPHVDFGLEWLLLALAPLVWTLRNRKRNRRR